MEDRLGPKNLGKLFQHMVGHMRAAPRLMTLKGRKDDKKPNKFCPICLKQHGTTSIIEDTALRSENCPECDGHLKEGYIAVVSTDGRYAFMRHSTLAEVGPIVRVSKENMDEIAKVAKIKLQSDGNS